VEVVLAALHRPMLDRRAMSRFIVEKLREIQRNQEVPVFPDAGKSEQQTAETFDGVLALVKEASRKVVLTMWLGY